MLTKNDLAQIQKIVSNTINTTIDTRVPEIVREIVRKEVPGIIRTEVPGIVRTETKSIKSDIAQIRQDIKAIVSFFDREYIDLRKRIERIEEHLQLPPVT